MREVVNGQRPDVLIPEFPVDTTDLVDMAEKLYINVFKSLSLTDEDKAKTQMYQTEAKRKAIQSSTLDLDDYIKVLEMRADIHLMCDEELERVHQLCNKTNQFNLTTKRYTQKEISDMLADVRYDIFTISSSDKFGDNGLVGVAICERKEKAVVIDTFLMSCRVMGRKLENVIISELVKYYKGQYNTMIGLFVQTKKNIPVVKKYDELGFAVVSEDESGKTYSYDISKGYEKVNSYSEIIFNGEHK